MTERAAQRGNADSRILQGLEKTWCDIFVVYISYPFVKSEKMLLGFAYICYNTKYFNRRISEHRD
jgi:hypothetical protein